MLERLRIIQNLISELEFDVMDQLNLKGPEYVKILRHGLLPVLEQFPFGHRLMMDNAPSHTSAF